LGAASLRAGGLKAQCIKGSGKQFAVADIKQQTKDEILAVRVVETSKLLANLAEAVRSEN